MHLLKARFFFLKFTELHGEVVEKLVKLIRQFFDFFHF
jgi:hypothetical protein